MNTKKYRWIFYFISATIATTIAVQFYWNYKNYEDNKQRVTNEIQLSLDTAIEEYFSGIAKEEITTIINYNSNETASRNVKYDSILSESKHFQKFKAIIKSDSVKNEPKFEITNISFTTDDETDFKKTDSILKDFAAEMSKKNKTVIETSKKLSHNKHSGIQFFSGKKSADSIRLFKSLKPIFLSVTSNIIEYKQLDSLIENQLAKRKIPLSFVFKHYKNDTLFHASNNTIFNKKLVNNISSKSTFAKRNEEFKLQFSNPTFEALKRSFGGIFLSFLLSILIISCLFYLLKIINQQKELATIKNDLISNITHEFKTPIATVSTAIEAIQNFNVLDDKEKTDKYISMSSIQLKKLNQMVEKLLETATLDSEQLMLKKETVDVVEIINRLVNKHKIISKNKELNFTTNTKPVYVNVDVFHFENVISNLIDNAIKYGGENIEINVNSILDTLEISIADNGKGIEKIQQDKVFDKFYRVPKGNTHNVKGFGIGLYYCKKIIEKHNGSISLSSDKNLTIFKININNA